MTEPLPRPLVLLDIDGVLHDRQALLEIRSANDPQAAADSLDVTVATSHGHRMAFPIYMPELVQHLAETAEVWWCTTWRHRANDEIREHLGVDSLAVVDDGTRSVGLEWKVRTASPLIAEAVSHGRRVYWIEDFHGTYPELDAAVTFVDTGDA
ncbi:unnamed protein product, partial [marine sediment metagenome]